MIWVLIVMSFTDGGMNYTLDHFKTRAACKAVEKAFIDFDKHTKTFCVEVPDDPSSKAGLVNRSDEK
jgi:hypothetical protein